MSEPEQLEDLPFERSSIAAIGKRRGWWIFGKEESPDAADDGPASDADDGPPVRSMLGALASLAGSEPEAPPPSTSSMLALDPAASPAPESPAEDRPAVVLVAHSTLAELAGLEERPTSAFPIERALLIALLLHVVLLIVLIVAPAPVPANAGLIAAMTPPERDESPIPVIFQELPGAARTNPKRSPLSDADRRAGGGDPSKPKAETPFIPPTSGVAGLAPGPRAPRVPGTQQPAHPGARGEAERQASAEKAPAAADQKPDEFPNMRPPTTGPREVSKLAGLDRAIQEAARGTAGGEGGAPPANPDGGFVDSGGLSFDTSWYDWGPYAAEMIRRIKLHWDVPELARLGWKGNLTVRFFILADGRVADAKIIRGSGIPPFDFAALQAILKSDPFRPLPSDLHEDKEGITITFFYNMRPESE